MEDTTTLDAKLLDTIVIYCEGGLFLLVGTCVNSPLLMALHTMFVREVCRNHISSRRFYIKHIPSSGKLPDLPGVSYVLITHDRLKSRELGSLTLGSKLSCEDTTPGDRESNPKLIGYVYVRNLETWIELVL